MLPKLRYEVYIPTSYNDKTPIETKKYRFVKNKIQKKYGGLSVHPPNISGIWVNPKDKKVFCDNCFRYEIVVDKLQENEEYFENFKKELKELFNQHEIFMICTEIIWV
jgi:hypothetical protein